MFSLFLDHFISPFLSFLNVKSFCLQHMFCIFTSHCVAMNRFTGRSYAGHLRVICVRVSFGHPQGAYRQVLMRRHSKWSHFLIYFLYLYIQWSSFTVCLVKILLSLRNTHAHYLILFFSSTHFALERVPMYPYLFYLFCTNSTFLPVHLLKMFLKKGVCLFCLVFIV